jgi:Zn-dependent protease with chaperone function
MTSPEAFYFDGSSARRLSAHIELQPEGLAISGEGVTPAFWRYVDLRYADSLRDMLRIGAEGAPELARLEIRDPALIEAVVARCPDLSQRKRSAEMGAARIALWSLAAAASLVLTVVFLVPLVADRLAPLVPIPLEQRLGEAVDNQVRTFFSAEDCEAEAGRAALTKLGESLAAAADLPMPVEIAVLDSGIANAAALPGGQVYVFQGLLKLAESPDELAGVIAHEFGHVAGRDGLRKLLQTGGSSFLLGLLFGDVTGGGVLIFAAQVLVDSRYSREAETAADGFAAELMLEVGRAPAALGTMLGRLDSGGNDDLAFLASHPVTAERITRLESFEGDETDEPLLTPAEWQDLKAICGASVSVS